MCNIEAKLGAISTTSSPTSSLELPPSASAQDGPHQTLSRSPLTPRSSPALSSASTAEGDISPDLPPLPAPRLPGYVLGQLRTPTRPENASSERNNPSWLGSPYPFHLRRPSLSSEPSEDSPIHNLDLQTPFLRPIPTRSISQTVASSYSLSAAASILANRARRPTRGITEDWIRQHTVGGSEFEQQHWLSDGPGESEDSSLSGSCSGDETAWFDEHSLRTPRAIQRPECDRDDLPSRVPRNQAGNDTLTQADIGTWPGGVSANMTTEQTRPSLDNMPDSNAHDVIQSQILVAGRPATPTQPGNTNASEFSQTNPVTPMRTVTKKSALGTPRLKKRVPWKGKNILVLLPADDDRGLPGKAPMPLNPKQTDRMFEDWKDLGYDVRGFDLATPAGGSEPGSCSQTRASHPDFDEMARERARRNYKIQLPDLKAWENEMKELQEAKLRALGVSSGDEEPSLRSLVAGNGISRQPSTINHPHLRFSPPLPTTSASSNHAMSAFPFPATFAPAAQSPGIPGAPSPIEFTAGRCNQRASISVSSPHAWSPQMMMGHRMGSPSLANLNSMRSPHSPIPPDGMSLPSHQRHQSLQYPILQHQFQGSQQSPRLQDLREDEEEDFQQRSSKTPDMRLLMRHNASNSLQKEIDEAEYHLEEQMRSALDNDEDYSPHREASKQDMAGSMQSDLCHPSRSVVQFGPPIPPQFGAAGDGLVLHHPRPHSRGHSLSQKYFTEEDANKEGYLAHNLFRSYRLPEESEVERGGKGLETGSLNKHTDQLSYSTASNPWTDNESSRSFTGSARRQPSHGSKSSISKLNVKAPEFKFNPQSTFKPGELVFGSNTFQPTSVFSAGSHPTISANSSFSLSNQSTAKIKVGAAAFSPGQSEFSFSSNGPKFRPDAPAFNPFRLCSESVTSPTTAPENGSTRPHSIFGNIDLTGSGLKLAKRSKAIPIVRPASRQSLRADHEEDALDDSGRPMNTTRMKRAKASVDPEDEVARFAVGYREVPSAPESRPQQHDGMDSDALPSEFKWIEEEHLHAETALSPTTISGIIDTQAATNASEENANQNANDWTPFEFKADSGFQKFKDAWPLSEDVLKPGYQKSLSTASKAFVPGVQSGSAPQEATSKSGDEFAKDLAAGRPENEDTKAIDANKFIETMQAVPVDWRSDSSHHFGLPASGSSTRTSGLSASRFASCALMATTPAAPSKPKGLAASRFASLQKVADLEELRYTVSPSPAPEIPPNEHMIPPLDIQEAENDHLEKLKIEESIMADIDAVMRHLNQNPSTGVNKTVEPESPQWQPSSPTRRLDFAALTNASPVRLAPQGMLRSHATGPSLQQYRQLTGYLPQVLSSTEHEDPFMDPPMMSSLPPGVHHLNSNGSLPASDWEGAFSEDEQVKLESRVNFFDSHVNELMGSLLAAHLEPLEQSLDGIKHALASVTRNNPSRRRERRSISADVRESDADDEDDEMPMAKRSASPRKDRRMEQVRVAVVEALAAQERYTEARSSRPGTASATDSSAILKAIHEIRDQFAESLHLDFRGEDLRNIVEDAVEKRVPQASQSMPHASNETAKAMEARVRELEERLRNEEAQVQSEASLRRAAEDRALDLDRKLHSAEARLQAEIMRTIAFDQRLVDLEDRLHNEEAKAKQEVEGKRTAEDRLSEVQRLLRIASEEELRLREIVENRDQNIRLLEDAAGEAAIRLALLQGAQANAQQTQSENQNRINIFEVDLRDAKQEALHFQSEAERLTDVLRRHDDDLAQVRDENKALHKIIDTLGVQVHENERVLEVWRNKFLRLQQEMERSTREISQENARWVKKEQTWLAREEVLDARLQAEARTRERTEAEIERLESGERKGMRSLSECKRLEELLVEMSSEKHTLHQSMLRYQAEFQEARDSGAREVQRTRALMQAELEDANHQVNVVRAEYEEQMSRLRSQMDQFRMDADTAKARYEMLLEEAQTSRSADLKEAARKHQNEIDDLQTRYERQVNKVTEDAQRAEQNLLERLSISTSKTEHLQDKVVHLEDKLEIAKAAALAAAKAARSPAPNPKAAAQSITSSQMAAVLQAQPAPQPDTSVQAEAIPAQLPLPEKISPQALRESIMVLQEQLQERERKIDELEQTCAKLDPDAESKITKRDDEITWLRELLAVRHSDFSDIITALERPDGNTRAIRDAVIRLKANLQMEEQERQRALSGFSAINAPSIAAIKPRVALAVGPLAAAWDNWRRSDSNGMPSPSLSGVFRSTPAKNGSGPESGFLGGLLTPPASQLRQTPSAGFASVQPTAFSSTGRRFTAKDLANRPRAPMTATKASKMSNEAPSPHQRLVRPVTPSMMRRESYDEDAQAEDFGEASRFFEDDDE